MAKVQYVQVNHDEVEIAFEGLTFQSALTKPALNKFSLIEVEAHVGNTAQVSDYTLAA